MPFLFNTVNANKNTGNIAQQTISFNGLAAPFVQTFKYDAPNRLTEARETVNNQQKWIQSFGYDRYGNRTAFSQQGGTIPAAQPSIDANTNRFATGQGYTYDYNGNLIQDAQGRQFAFNGENKQTQVKDASNNIVGQYFYDGDGKRVKKIEYDANGVEKWRTIFVYDGMGKLIAEYSSEPPVQNPTVNYTATDPLGSPRVITNKLGEIVSRRDFMPFGEEIYSGIGSQSIYQKYSANGVKERETMMLMFSKNSLPIRYQKLPR